MSETPRQKYLRNHQENIRTMRAVKLRAEREGEAKEAEFIGKIIEAWEGIGAIAQKQEDEQQ